jgi:hypothetical protein
MLKISKYASWFLLFIFSFIQIPVELIHELHGHEETHCHPGELKFENQHVHCKMLQIEAQTYTPPALVVLGQDSGIDTSFFIVSIAKESCASIPFSDPRAPPTA